MKPCMYLLSAMRHFPVCGFLCFSFSFCRRKKSVFFPAKSLKINKVLKFSLNKLLFGLLKIKKPEIKPNEAIAPFIPIPGENVLYVRWSLFSYPVFCYTRSKPLIPSCYLKKIQKSLYTDNNHISIINYTHTHKKAQKKQENNRYHYYQSFPCVSGASIRPDVPLSGGAIFDSQIRISLFTAFLRINASEYFFNSKTLLQRLHFISISTVISPAI